MDFCYQSSEHLVTHRGYPPRQKSVAQTLSFTMSAAPDPPSAFAWDINFRPYYL